METTKRVIELEDKIQQGLGTNSDYIELRKLYLNTGMYDKLLNLHSLILKLKLTNLEIAGVHYEKGEVLHLLNGGEKAVPCFQESLQLLEEDDESINSLFLKAMNHYHLFLLLSDPNKSRQHAEDAINYFRMVITQLPGDEEEYLGHSRLAEIYSRLGDYDKAILYYGAALEISSDTHDVVWALTGIASTYGKKKELHKAIHYFEEALRKANNTFPITQIYYQLGKMYFDANYMSKSGQAFRNALKYKNNDPASKNNQEYETDILWHLGTIAYEEDDYDNIVPYLSKVLEKIEDDHYYYANSHLTLGHYYLMIEDYKKARRHYNKVLTAPRAANEELKTAEECLAQTPQHFS